MAEKIYISKNSISEESEEMKVPVNGKSRRVVKIYCSVNGLSELCFRGKKTIPRMTDNTTPRGTASAGNGTDSSIAYRAFDRDDDTMVGAATENVYGYVQYDYPSRVDIEEVEISACKLAMGGYDKTYTLQISLYTDGAWVIYGTIDITENHGVTYVYKKYTLKNGVMRKVEKIKVESLTMKTYGSSYHIRRIQAYRHNPDIRSLLYPNANVYDAGTVSTNNGNRSPVSKNADGDAVVFCIRNGYGTGYGGNWMVTVCVALTPEAALIVAPNIQAGTVSYTVNGITYYLGMQGSNANWGGATTISSDCPIFDDWQITTPNNYPSQAQFEEILQRLGITT